MENTKWHTDAAAGQVPGVLLGLLLGVLLAVALSALVLLAAPAVRLLDDRRPAAQAIAAEKFGSLSSKPPPAPSLPDDQTFLP